MQGGPEGSREGQRGPGSVREGQRGPGFDKGPVSFS